MQSHILSSAALDTPTLFFVAVSVTGLLGLLLIFAWLQEKTTRALAWWGSAYLLGASSMALWSAPTPLIPVPSQISGALIFIACGTVWNGVRLFHKRSVLPLATFAGALAWLLIYATGLSESETARATFGALIIAVYTFSIAFELWSERRQSLFSRTAAVIVPLLHGLIFMIPIAMKALLPDDLSHAWLEVLALETMFYAIGTAFIVLLMVKDHQVVVERTAANTDPLTGLLNRRGFMECAAQLCAKHGKPAKHGKAPEPVTLMIFDLDHFKSINDRFGHGVGDDALRVFAKSVRATMRADDVIGRLGGEEFAAIVAANGVIAGKIAERVRSGFEAAGKVVSDCTLDATVSIGTATAPADTRSIDWLIVRADTALYSAKKAGRNRVEASPPWTDADRRLGSVTLAGSGSQPAKPQLATAKLSSAQISQQ